MKNIIVLFIICIISIDSFSQNFLLPINCENRTELASVKLTHIGKFGEIRKARSGIPEHLHTGIDIKRPSANYLDEPIYAIGEGFVISVRNDGPYALIIIEHNHNGETFWSEYEHVAGIRVNVGDVINENTIIARFMNKKELNQYGWQFDHFHFEILKIPPPKVKYDKKRPQHFFGTYNLTCYTQDKLNHRYYNPIEFLKELLSPNA